MELESVPAEIDTVQRKLTQLELVARQLADETEEHAQQRLEEVERGDGIELKRELANLTRAVGSEKLGVGDVQQLRQRQQEIAHQLRAARRHDQRQAVRGRSRRRGAFSASVYELDTERKQLEQQLEQSEQLAGPNNRQRGG